MDDRKKELLNRLINDAQFKGSGLWSNGNGIMYASSGDKIPDRYMPGAVIKNLSEEDRKLLLTCTEEDFKSINWRPEDYKKYRKEMERKSVKQATNQKIQKRRS